jgi:hypothetical protein
MIIIIIDLLRLIRQQNILIDDPALHQPPRRGFRIKGHNNLHALFPHKPTAFPFDDVGEDALPVAVFGGDLLDVYAVAGWQLEKALVVRAEVHRVYWLLVGLFTAARV